MGTALPGLLCVPLSRPNLDGALTVAGRARPFSDEDLALLESLARQGAIAIENARAHEVNRNFFTHASEMLVSLLDAQDVHYEGHSRAVAALADMVARRLGLPEDERRTIHFAALLHDVGKLRLRPGLLARAAGSAPRSESSSSASTRPSASRSCARLAVGVARADHPHAPRALGRQGLPARARAATRSRSGVASWPSPRRSRR